MTHDLTAAAADYVERINKQASRAVTEIIRTGDLLIEAKAAVPHGTFERMFEDHPYRLPSFIHMTSRYARKFMAIAASSAIRAHADRLGPNVKVLEQIARLPDAAAEQAITSGAITPATTTREARLIVKSKERNPEKDWSGWKENARFCWGFSQGNAGKALDFRRTVHPFHPRPGFSVRRAPPVCAGRARFSSTISRPLLLGRAGRRADQLFDDLEAERHFRGCRIDADRLDLIAAGDLRRLKI